MKLLRVLFTIVLAILLFPTILMSLNAVTTYRTLYNREYVASLLDDSSLTYEIAEQATELALDTMTLYLDENAGSIPLDSEVLRTSLSENIDRAKISAILDEFLLGSYGYYFGDNNRLPVIKILYLQDLIDIGFDTAVTQLTEGALNLDMSDFKDMLENPPTAEQLDTEDLDKALDYFKSNAAEFGQISTEALSDLIDNYKKDGELPTFQEITDDVSTIMTETVTEAPILPKTLDFHQLSAEIYGKEINPITALRPLTKELPIHVLWLLGIMLLGLPLIYLVIHRFRLLSTVQFFSLTGLLAALLNFAGTLLLYWFVPNNGPWNRVMNMAESIPSSAEAIIETMMDFTELLLSRSMSEALTVNLTALTAFLILLIVTEVIKRLYPAEDVIDGSNEALFQFLGAVVIAVLMVIFVRYHWHQIVTLTDTYIAILNSYRGHTIDIDPITLLDSMK